MNRENKTLSDALLVLLNDYEKGNVSSIKFSMDATLVNEKLRELELENEKLKSENEKLKADLKIAVDALKQYGGASVYVASENCNISLAKRALEKIEGEKNININSQDI